MRVILQGTSLDRSVTKREEVTIRSPDGGTIQFVREPFSVRRERVLLRGDDVFREVLEEDGGFWAFHRGVWTQYAENGSGLAASNTRADARHASPRPEKYRIDGATIYLRRPAAKRPRARDRSDADGRWAAPSGRPHGARFRRGGRGATVASSTQHGTIYRLGSSSAPVTTRSASSSWTSRIRRSSPGRPGS